MKPSLRLLLPVVFIAVAGFTFPLLKFQLRTLLFGPQPNPLESNGKPPFSALLIGWDGSRRETVKRLMSEGKLPVLKAAADQGTWIDVDIKEGRTDTKAGWSQILSGYSASVTGVLSNRDYKPIPKGFTIFERLKQRYGQEITTLFISGKVNNIGARGPHKVCINCKSRFEDTHGKTGWWDESQEPPTKKGKPREYVSRDGEPYFNALSSIDVYNNKLGEAEHVLAKAKERLNEARHKAFFAFVHFEEPDEQGHLYGEGSQEYLSALEQNDKNLGLLIEFARRIDPQIKIFVLSDHGFDAQATTHKRAPETFWLALEKNLRGAADRRDFTPTLLELYGFNLKEIEPPLNGRSLLQ